VNDQSRHVHREYTFVTASGRYWTVETSTQVAAAKIERCFPGANLTPETIVSLQIRDASCCKG
jgi:hypothetical protein